MKDNYRPVNRTYFEYTDMYLKKAKWFWVFALIKLSVYTYLMYKIATTSLLLSGVSFELQVFLKLFSYLLLLILLIPALYQIGRDYRRDELYILDGILYFDKSAKTRYGTLSDPYRVKEISRVKVTKNSIIIYGKIKLRLINDLTFKRLKLTAKITNIDELIKFAQSKGAEIDWRK